MKAVTPYPSSVGILSGTSRVARKCRTCINIVSGLLTLCMVVISAHPLQAQNCQFEVGNIVGPTGSCPYTGNVGEVATYSVTSLNVEGIVWSVPGQVTLLSGQGTNTIRVKFRNGFVAGNITAKFSSSCDERSESRTLRIAKSVPPVPFQVTGPGSVCDNVTAAEPAVYSVEEVPDAVRYNWTVPAGAQIVSGQGTNSLTVLFTPTFKFGNIKVRSISGCGNSAFLLYPVTAKGPVGHSIISGRTTGICGADNVVEYSIDPIPSALSYNWSTSVAGASIDNDGTKATITFPSFTTGTVNVSAVGACGVSQVGRVAISSKGLKAGAINGPDTACIGTVQTYSVNLVPGASSYQWTVPIGSVISAGAGTSGIQVTIGNESGFVTVRPVSACDAAGMPSSLELIVEDCPDEPGGPSEMDPNISLFPNPTAGIIHLKFTTAKAGNYKVNVTNPTSACTVFTFNGAYSAGDNEVCIDLSALGDGHYIFYLVTDEFNHQERIEVKHCGG